MIKKNKNILLVAGFVFTLFICYQLAISKTIIQKQEYDVLKKQQVLFKNAPQKLSLLKKKEVYYDSILNKYQLDGSSVENNLLKTINVFATTNNIKVVSFLKPHIIFKEDLIIKTYEFILEGDFNNINQLIHQLEQMTKFGEVVNLQFEKKKNHKTGKQYLQANILLKSFG
ncbi:hypothetical protein [Psychroserpens sp.]|uniref:hypothetical protein n=1 Tax=Psychroserpens sp. TaxID=2020870 RepID=UPI002B276722|nr:hypothetical protein [Psychroserpens sp.]